MLPFLRADYLLFGTKHIKEIAGRWNLVEVITGFDITDPENVRETVEYLKQNGVSSIVNSTGILDVDGYELERRFLQEGKLDQSLMYRTHVLGASYLAQAAKDNGILVASLGT